MQPSFLVAMMLCASSATASFAQGCLRVSLSEVASAVKQSRSASADVRSRSCMWAGAAMRESGGSLCSHNSNNFGILQLSRANVERLGLTPEQYMNQSLQEQVDGWALAANTNNGSRGYIAINGKITQTLHLGHVMDGVLAACSQFGDAICNNDIDLIEAGRPLPIPGSSDAIPCRESTCGGGTANQDGNGQTIISWGLVIQREIHQSRCVE
jgi:hypothetical protein